MNYISDFGSMYLESSMEIAGVSNNFFKVEAKCGHVGKNLYFKGTFYVRAKNARRAATVVRRFPRVKHDRANAIISVAPISFAEFIKGQREEYSRPYYQCLSKQEQNCHWDEISKDIYEDDYLSDIEKKVFKTKKHSLRKTYNLDPMYLELKNYQGNISKVEIV